MGEDVEVDQEVGLVKAIAREAADEALRGLMSALGVDGADPKELRELQADLRDLREWRVSVGVVKRTAITTAVGLVVTGFAALVWAAVKGG